MIPASVLMAMSVYGRASDSMCPRFFGILSYRAADRGGFWVRSCGPFWLVNSGVATRKTAIAQDCGSRAACTGRRARVHHDSGQRFDGYVGVWSCERFDVSEVFWHFPLVILSALVASSNHSTFLFCPPQLSG